MHRQGFDLQLTQYDERGWRATFYATGMEHSPTSATGTGWEPTPWHATQRAAWEALGKAEERLLLKGHPTRAKRANEDLTNGCIQDRPAADSKIPLPQE